MAPLAIAQQGFFSLGTEQEKTQADTGTQLDDEFECLSLQLPPVKGPLNPDCQTEIALPLRPIKLQS